VGIKCASFRMFVCLFVRRRGTRDEKREVWDVVDWRVLESVYSRLVTFSWKRKVGDYLDAECTRAGGALSTLSNPAHGTMTRLLHSSDRDSYFVYPMGK